MLCSILLTLTDSFWSLNCLANTNANVSVSITYNYESCNSRITSTLNNLCYTLDGNYFIF